MSPLEAGLGQFPGNWTDNLSLYSGVLYQTFSCFVSQSIYSGVNVFLNILGSGGIYVGFRCGTAAPKVQKEQAARSQPVQITHPFHMRSLPTFDSALLAWMDRENGEQMLWFLSKILTKIKKSLKKNKLLSPSDQ